MDNLLFSALAIALIYYFFYLPSPKSNANRPLKHQETQTEVDETPEIIKQLRADNHQKEQTIIGLNNSYDKLETKKAEQINELKKQLELLSKEKKEDEKTINLLIQEENTKLNRVLTLLGIEGVVFSGEEAALLIKR